MSLQKDKRLRVIVASQYSSSSYANLFMYVYLFIYFNVFIMYLFIYLKQLFTFVTVLCFGTFSEAFFAPFCCLLGLCFF